MSRSSWWRSKVGSTPPTPLVLRSPSYRECAARPVVTFDADRFLDYRARRPVMQLRDGINIGLVWPELVMKAGRTPAGRDVVILGGHEPDMQWRAFCEAVLELSGRLGVTRMIGLGAYPIAVPHTRPSRLSMSCSTPEAAVGLPYQRNSVDVAAGAGAALEQTLATAGISAMTLWAQVPHYLASAPYAGATVALLEGLASVAGVEVDVTELRTEVRRLEPGSMAWSSPTPSISRCSASWNRSGTRPLHRAVLPCPKARYLRATNSPPNSNSSSATRAERAARFCRAIVPALSTSAVSVIALNGIAAVEQSTPTL